MNGQEIDNNSFLFEAVEGDEILELVPNQNVCNVRALAAGTAVIRVSHPLAEYDFDVRVFAFDVDIPYIMVSKTFIILSKDEYATFIAAVDSPPRPADFKNEFSYVLDESEEGKYE
jgi:hypothetical protein